MKFIFKNSKLRRKQMLLLAILGFIGTIMFWVTVGMSIVKFIEVYVFTFKTPLPYDFGDIVAVGIITGFVYVLVFIMIKAEMR